MEDTRTLRGQLIRAFSDEELRTLCFDFYPEVYEQFSVGMTKGSMVQLLIDYCVRRHELGRLRELLDHERPGMFREPAEGLAAALPPSHVRHIESLSLDSIRSNVSSSSRPHAGLPRDLLMELQRTLLECNEFGNHTALRAVFASTELSLWRNGLPHAESPAQQIDLTIDYLRDKYLANGKNALALFVYALSDRYDPGDELHGRLVALVDRLTNCGA